MSRLRFLLLRCVTAAVLLGAAFAADAALPPPVPSSSDSSDPLVQVLVSKGILSPQEARSLGAGAGLNQRLALLLKQKGVLSDADYAGLQNPNERLVGLSSSPAGLKPAVLREPLPTTTEALPKPAAAAAMTPVIAAITPIRALPSDATKKDGLIPDIKLGSGARMKIYGMFKASMIRDSSSPLGTDMPISGFLSDTGPTASPEFHVKARAMRIGAMFEWPDESQRLTFTGKIETDFEGSFTRALNRNISSVRSSQASIRLAYGRMDYQATDKTAVFGVFGQDWTPFGSSTLPAFYETTGLGLGFATLYERAPQFRFGFNHNFGGSRTLKLQPEFALVLPAFGLTPSNVADQLGMGERQGADGDRPTLQGRLVTQWQFDTAKAVAPAQFIISFVEGGRTALMKASDVPDAPAPLDAKFFKNAFPRGARLDSNRWGVSGELQLPTRYVTVLMKYWSGADLRFYFVGNLLSNFNDVAGLSSMAFGPSIDGSTNMIFGVDAAGNAVVAPQRPVRDKGGFINLGFPLSRIFKAQPEGRNAGWTLYLHYGMDNATSRDVRRAWAPVAGKALNTALVNKGNKNDVGAVTLNYAVNKWVTFTIEQSYYRTRAVGGPGSWPLFEGKPARSWHDVRQEIGTTFNF